MNYRNFIVGAMVFALAATASGCSDGNSDNSGNADKSTSDTITTADITTTAESTEETTEEKIPPTPTAASDVNTVTFDDGDFSFAEVISDDAQAAVGTLSVVEVMGEKMLRFADDNSVPLEGRVQKIKINAAQLVGLENLPKVRRIEFDMYAMATADKFVNENGENVLAPGWIGGGGGTVTAMDDKWYDFGEFSGGEYDFEFSGAVHGQFKFLLADTGQCWSEDMTDANFLIMRWGLGNESDMYIDNIVFYDEDGKSIPIVNIPIAKEDSDDTAEETADTDNSTADSTDAAEKTEDNSSDAGSDVKSDNTDDELPLQ